MVPEYGIVWLVLQRPRILRVLKGDFHTLSGQMTSLLQMVNSILLSHSSNHSDSGEQCEKQAEQKFISIHHSWLWSQLTTNNPTFRLLTLILCFTFSTFILIIRWSEARGLCLLARRFQFVRRPFTASFNLAVVYRHVVVIFFFIWTTCQHSSKVKVSGKYIT